MQPPFLRKLLARVKSLFFAAVSLFGAGSRPETKKGVPVDAATLRAVRDGDHDAFRNLYLHYVESIQHFLSLLTRDQEAAKELTQNIFITLWEKREKIDPSNNISGYLYTIARNSAFKHLEHLKVERKFYTEASHGTVASGHSDEEFIAAEIELLIDMVIARMPDQRKKVFSLYYYQSLSPDEICKTLDLKRSTVETHLSLARKDIKDIL